VHVNANGESRDGILESDNLGESGFLKQAGGKNRIRISDCQDTSGKKDRSHTIIEIHSEEGDYRGETLNNKCDGYGIMEAPSEVYEGYWKNGHRHGKGKLTTSEFNI
jgi:hypothetical protein